jgi:HEPN domain-containing protein
MDAQTELLLRKSAANEQAIACADLERVPDVFGFQTQQALEKLLKALLNEAGVRYPRTHDLAELVALVESTDQPLPQTPISLSRLTAFAVEFRYDDVPSGLALDAVEARTTVARMRKHVEGRLEAMAARQKSPPLS